MKVNFIIWSPTKINKDERNRITVSVCTCVYLYAHTHSNYICIQLLKSWWAGHMTVCGVKLLGYSLVVLAHVSWCFPKQIPGRFRVCTGQGSLPGCRYFGCGGVKGRWWHNFSKNGGYQPCHAMLPGLRAWEQCLAYFIYRYRYLAYLSKSRIKRGFKSPAERTNAGTLYYHQLYCNSLLEQWQISTVHRNFEKQSFFFSTVVRQQSGLNLCYSYFMCEIFFSFLETSNKIKKTAGLRTQ